MESTQSNNIEGLTTSIKNKRRVRRLRQPRQERPAGIKIVGCDSTASVQTTVNVPEPERTTPVEQPKPKKHPIVKCSAPQQKLFDLMAAFAVDTTTGWLANAYKMFTREMMRSSMLPIVMSQFAERYFNQVAFWIYDRSEPFINERFDAMLAVELPEIEESGNKAYDPMDLLNLIVAMCMQSLINMNIKDIITDDYAGTMAAIQSHLKFIIGQFNHIALSLRGCNCEENHTPPAEDQKVFNLEIKKAVMTGDGSVEIKDDWFDLV